MRNIRNIISIFAAIGMFAGSSAMAGGLGNFAVSQMRGNVVAPRPAAQAARADASARNSVAAVQEARAIARPVVAASPVSAAPAAAVVAAPVAMPAPGGGGGARVAPVGP